jgi:peptidoglycan/LPS O-acetylase OafA/YrhL
LLIQHYWGAILLKLTLISNFFPSQALRPVGPWWFLSFIFQFYVVFPALLSMARKYGEYTLAIISCAGVLLSFLSRNSDVNIYFTIIGHMPELCLGIYLARRDKLHVPYYMVFTIFLLFILGNLYYSFWLISHFCALILMLLVFNSVRHTIRKHDHVNNLLVFYGALSMYMFFVHGFLREPMVVWAREYGYWTYSLLLCIAFLAITTISSYLLQTAELRIRQWFAQRESSPDLL